MTFASFEMALICLEEMCLTVTYDVFAWIFFQVLCPTSNAVFPILYQRPNDDRIPVITIGIPVEHGAPPRRGGDDLKDFRIIGLLSHF